MTTSEKNTKIKKKSKKKKCAYCNLKIKTSILEIKCRCRKFFCSNHLLPECHNCDYDYKKDKVKLDKVVNEKINKI